MSNNTKERLSRLMRMSWDIQHSKHKTRAKSLQAAWAILTNEDVTVFYLATKLNHQKPLKPKALGQMGLFPKANTNF